MNSRALSALACVLAITFAGCAGDAAAPGPANRIDLRVVVVGSSEVASVEFQLSCDSGFTLSGELNVVEDRMPPVWATIMDVPAGDCTVTLIAYDEAGLALCTGSRDVTVVPGTTTKVDILLMCMEGGLDELGNVDIDATFETVDGNRCPRLHTLNAVPDEILRGGSSEVSVLASDEDGDELTTALTATSGFFADASAPSTTYSCGASGAQTIRVLVSDGDPSCDKTKSFVVTCEGSSSLRPLPQVYLTANAINYSAFRAAGPAFGELPSDEDVLEDLTLLGSAGYDLLRLFGADAVSEKILRIAAERFPEMRFQQGLFLEGVFGGCESENNDSQIETAIRLANSYESVVTVSVGNETSFFAGFMPLECLEEYITRTRNAVTQPVTADDDYTFYAGTFARKPDTVLPLLDFVAIHMYPITNYTQWNWRQLGVEAGPLRAEAMMNASLAKAKDNYDKVYQYVYQDASGAMVTIGESLPIVIGETGWKWRQTNQTQEIEAYAATEVNAKWYYDLMRTWERSPGGPLTIFHFVSFDETWKGTDDGWGLWDELRMPLYGLCDTPAGSPCNNPIYQGAGFFSP